MGGRERRRRKRDCMGEEERRRKIDEAIGKREMKIGKRNIGREEGKKNGR